MHNSLLCIDEGGHVAGALMKEYMLLLELSGNARFTWALDAFSRVPLTTETTYRNFPSLKAFSKFMKPALYKPSSPYGIPY